MLSFRTTNSAGTDTGFRCVADFSAAAAVNLNFFDAEQRMIPFHLSLRRDEQLIVVNRRDAAGWRREIRIPAQFGFAPVSAAVKFSRGRVEVRVDERLVGRFDAYPRLDLSGRLFMRRGFPDLARIAFVAVDGPCLEGSVQIDALTQRAALDHAVLNDALEVVLGVEADVSEDVALVVGGRAERIPAVRRGVPHMAGQWMWAAVVPGRVWDGRGEHLDLAMVTGGGAVLGSVSVTRRELAAKIGALAESGVLATDDRAALQAIEHTRHAGLLQHLTDLQREALEGAAARFRLGAYMRETSGNRGKTGVQISDIPADAEVPIWDALRNRFTQTMRETPKGDPIALLAGLIDDGELTPAQQGVLFTSLTEWFCLNDRLRDLALLWREKRVPAAATTLPRGDLWTLSALLPIYYCEGRFADVAQALEILTPRSPHWVQTPNLGWITREIAVAAPDLTGRFPTPEERNAILYGVGNWIDHRAGEYWERTHCVALIDGQVALLANASTLAQWQVDAVIKRVMWAYGLTPSFWRAVEVSMAENGWALPLRMQVAHDAFLQLHGMLAESHIRTPNRLERIDALLKIFQRWGTASVARFRRDLFAPTALNIAPGSVPDAEDWHKVGLNPDEAALRFVAAPRPAGAEAGDMPAALSEAVARGLKAAQHMVARGQLGDVQAALFKEAQAVLQAPDAAGMGRVLTHITVLSDARSRFLGLGIGLGLVNGLLSQDRDAEAGRLVRHVLALMASITDAGQHAEVCRAPAPGLALAALRRAHPTHDVTRRAEAGLTILMEHGAAIPDGEQAPAFDAGATPLLDTVVCLYTCRVNLGTRVQAIRDGWMALLRDMGVPCLVFVGAGDGRIEGNVVHLNAPDDYEGLPQKTLAMVRWVLENTRYSYLVKVDDDCFLDPQAFFGDLTHLKFDYYGRPLSRVRGQMDRTWHMAKSTHARGRLELDKSPEPSRYADGGSGYALSRIAMAALCAAADSPRGQELSHLSFMEDKLVGDLLAQQGISVDGEEYRISVLRRTRPGGPLVPAWENGFLPFKGAGIRLAHLDGHERQAEVLAASQRSWPASAKIWPSFQPARLGWCSNALDLISSPDKLARVNAAPVAVVACLRNERIILAQFLAHYRALGVEGFLIADNGSDDGSFEFLAAQPDVALFAVDTEYSASHYGVAWQQALLGNFRTGRWTLVADADEFLFWNRDLSGSLPELVREFDAEGATAARVFMLDMYPQGPLTEADFVDQNPFEQTGFTDRAPFLAVSGARGPYSDAPIWTSALRHRLIPEARSELFVAQKYALLKYLPWMQLSEGLHFVAEATVARRELLFAHFKYNAAFRAKAENEVARRQHFNNAEEYRKYLALVAEGRDVIYDPEISVRWDTSEFVRARCGREAEAL